MSLEFVNTQNHFFSDRTSLAIPSAFVRLGSFKRGSMYMSPHAASTTFFKNFYDCLQPDFPQQDANTFSSRFSAFHPLPPPRRSRFGAQKDNLDPHDHLAANHAQISRYSLFSSAIIETSTTTSDNFSAGVSQTTPHDGCSDKTGRTNRKNLDMKIFTGIRFSYGISTFPIFANIIAHPCFRAIQALRKRKMPNLPKNHSREETRHPPIDPIYHPLHQAQSENIAKQLTIQT